MFPLFALVNELVNRQSRSEAERRNSVNKKEECKKKNSVKSGIRAILGHESVRILFHHVWLAGDGPIRRVVFVSSTERSAWSITRRHRFASKCGRGWRWIHNNRLGVDSGRHKSAIRPESVVPFHRRQEREREREREREPVDNGDTVKLDRARPLSDFDMLDLTLFFYCLAFHLIIWRRQKKNNQAKKPSPRANRVHRSAAVP